MTITTPAATTIEIIPSDTSYQYKALMGDNYVEIKTEVPDYVEVPVGSWFDILGERYTLLQPQSVVKIHSRHYEITLRFEGAQASLQKYMYRDTEGSLKFSMTAKLSEHLALIISNLNSRETGWSYTVAQEDTEKTITASHSTIAEILTSVVDIYKTEYQITGKQIAIGKVEYDKSTPTPLEYGKGKGFVTGVKRENYSNEKQIDVLFVQGSERNIVLSDYGAKYLHMPPSQTVIVNSNNYDIDATGSSIYKRGRNTPGAVEGSLDLSDIYPKREGTIETVIAENVEKNFYNFTDSTIPAALDYNQCVIEGEKPVVAFQTGSLAGKEFEYSEYIHATRTFKIVPQEIDGVTMPNADAFSLEQGNKYIVLNIKMPAAYIRDDASSTGASWQMAKEAAKYLSEHETPRFSFVGQLDQIWTSQLVEGVPRWSTLSPKIKVGGHVLFKDASIENTGVTIRITGVKSYINRPTAPEIELSNIAGATSISTALNKLEGETVAIRKESESALRFTKRGFRDARETAEALQAAILGLDFSDAISPITLSTMQVLIGDPGLQFRYVNSTTTPVQVLDGISMNNTTKVLTAPAGIIQHMTLGITEIKPNREAAAYKFWTIPQQLFDTSVLDAAKYYYLYLQCNKADGAGAYVLTDTAKEIEETTVYNFLVGLLNSENEGARSWVILYGYTEILPGQITVDRIRSADNNTYFDLAAGEIGGKIKFISTEGGLTDMAEWADTTEETIEDVRNKRALRIEKFATPGYDTFRENVPYSATLALKIFLDDIDETASMDIGRFVWMRLSENTAGDPGWNERHSNAGASIDITSEDLAGDTSFIVQFYDVENAVRYTTTF